MSDVIAGRIDLLDPLAHGASGELWRAVDRRYGAICAAKVMRQRDGAEVLRFVREQSSGAGPTPLSVHPHLLPPYTWVAEDETVVLALPLIRGGTLAQAVADHGALHPLLVAELLRQLLDALAAMHAANWLHRDVKPANLLLEHTGTAVPHLRLADFGLSLHRDHPRLTKTGIVHGTPGYMAPERQQGQRTGTGQDVWAAGAVAVHALAPQVDLADTPDPFPALTEALPDPRILGAEPLRQLLRTLLDPDPAARPSAAAARDALPLPSTDPRQWVLGASGEPFEVFDLVDPLPPDSPARGLPEVPPEGPRGLPAGPGEFPAETSAPPRRPRIWTLPVIGLLLIAVIALAVSILLGTLAVLADATSPPRSPAITAVSTTVDREHR